MPTANLVVGNDGGNSLQGTAGQTSSMGLMWWTAPAPSNEVP